VSSVCRLDPITASPTLTSSLAYISKGGGRVCVLKQTRKMADEELVQKLVALSYKEYTETLEERKRAEELEIEFEEILEQSRRDYEEALDEQRKSEEQYEIILKESILARRGNHDAFEAGVRTPSQHQHLYRPARELCPSDEEIMALQYDAVLRESLLSQDAQAGAAWGSVSMHANFTQQPRAIEAELPGSNMEIVLPQEGDGCIHSIQEYNILCRKMKKIQDMRDQEMKALQVIKNLKERRLAIFTALHENFGGRGQDLVRTMLDQNLDYTLPALISSPRRPDQQEIWNQRFRSATELASFQNKNSALPRD